MLSERIKNKGKCDMASPSLWMTIYMDKLAENYKEYSFYFITDVAQAYVAKYIEQVFDSFGIGCRSFYHMKNLILSYDGNSIFMMQIELIFLENYVTFVLSER